MSCREAGAPREVGGRRPVGHPRMAQGPLASTHLGCIGFQQGQDIALQQTGLRSRPLAMRAPPPAAPRPCEGPPLPGRTFALPRWRASGERERERESE